jgi:hypothetical protein
MYYASDLVKDWHLADLAYLGSIKYYLFDVVQTGSLRFSKINFNIMLRG